MSTTTTADHTTRVFRDQAALDLAARLMNYGATVTLTYAGSGHWNVSSPSPLLRSLTDTDSPER
jgi:hypothetical protein